MQTTWSEAQRSFSSTRRLPPLHSRLSTFLFLEAASFEVTDSMWESWLLDALPALRRERVLIALTISLGKNNIIMFVVSRNIKRDALTDKALVGGEEV